MDLDDGADPVAPAFRIGLVFEEDLVHPNQLRPALLLLVDRDQAQRHVRVVGVQLEDALLGRDDRRLVPLVRGQLGDASQQPGLHTRLPRSTHGLFKDFEEPADLVAFHIERLELVPHAPLAVQASEGRHGLRVGAVAVEGRSPMGGGLAGLVEALLVQGREAAV